ncbi:MAG: nucleoside triphosphate pyrophosphohydrolase family protein [Bacteroidia bacterium]|nr:nucleoside triphosphate pyrophosphohydrolase family protein [Bacteroidota bacterium]MBP6723034.1 nucleoside triphosphate pyrophosphohydrolase family protein [Bacteroidia bacterium]
MKTALELVEEFHHSFGIPARQEPTATIPEAAMRFEIMREENEEYREACEKNDLIAIADALGDQLYVLCGTILAHGLQDKIQAVLEEIHRSNMSKLDADGNPIVREDGKILKSEGYFRPNLAPILHPAE